MPSCQDGDHIAGLQLFGHEADIEIDRNAFACQQKGSAG